MGCGVLFPRDFECKSDSEGEGELIARVVEDRAEVNIEAEEYETDSGDEDDWWRPEVKIGDKVQVGEIYDENRLLVILTITGVFHEKWENYRQEGCGSSPRRLLPHSWHDEQSGKKIIYINFFLK